jgi:hypothetical protein
LLEAPFVEYCDLDEEEITILVHTKDRNLMSFNNIISNPAFYQGWLSISYRRYDREMTAYIVADTVLYMEYYTTQKQDKQ